MLTPDSIRARLEAEAQAQGLEILHACESGSRAWGLASTDSDYDVRFVYRRPLGRYLEMQRPVDVIGPVLEGELDFAGWDLPKFAAHLVRSNPSVLEWLGSPQFYLHDKGFLDQARDLANRYFDVRRAVHHYVGIGQSAWDGGRQADGTWNLKKFFYFARPTLAADFIVRHGAMAPVPFDELYAHCGDAGLSAELEDLVRHKAGVSEGTDFPVPGPLETELVRRRTDAARAADAFPMLAPDPEAANRFLLEQFGVPL